MIVASYADIAININTDFVKYYNDFYNILIKVTNQTISTDENDEDYIDYIISIREAILETLPPVITAMYEANKYKELLECLGVIVPFMQNLWNQTEYRTKTIVAGLIGLLGFVIYCLTFLFSKNFNISFYAVILSKILYLF